ncbi:alpha-(1,3)-fucosyltransferase 10 [Zerene cesonia]|uniref:alpha-(1,3)-fucosyltransferase 10 n=1 Tax=Zerene cesonia TaxID=33412 RepID=UPI0018E53AEF|nr:alpha-(1,3)-fucosyltransferase 10 [Zerene cesonia]
MLIYETTSTMNLFVKYILKVPRRVLKVTLSELLWVILVLSILLVYLILKNIDHDTEEIQSDYLPVILWWTAGFPGSETARNCPGNIKCNIISDHKSIKQNVDAYLFYASNIKFDSLPLPRKPKNVIWGLYHEESPRNVEELSHEEALRIFNYSSTFSRYSDVPYPLQFLDSIGEITSTKYFVPTKVKNNDNDIAPIMYLQTDCETATERDEYVKELMKHLPIDSYGACLNNKEMPAKFTQDYLEHLNDEDFLHFIAKYKFVLALENGVCDDYVTEKFWRAIKVGTVPIYFGSPSIRDWLPNRKSAILLEDHPTPELMSEYIKKILADDNLYEEHLEHKTMGLITNSKLTEELKNKPYQTDALQVVETFECFICQKIYDINAGVGKESVVNKWHYNCPKPISALTLRVNPNNDWVYSWERARRRAGEIEQRVLGSN